VSLSWTTAILLINSGAESGWAIVIKAKALLASLKLPQLSCRQCVINKVLFKYGMKEGVIYTELENLFKFNVI